MTSPLRHTQNFWREVFTLRGAVTLRVLPAVLAFGWWATLVYLLQVLTPTVDISTEVGPHEVVGALISLLLVLRTNSGYERWWEARKLWGGIVNQSRNLVLAALAYGSADAAWRRQVVRWTAAFAHAVRGRLRDQREVPELGPLLGTEAAAVIASGHAPSTISLHLAGLLRQGLDGFAFQSAEVARSGLIDYLGGCERILKTPLAPVYSITIRRFIFLFLGSLPFALLHKFKADWLTPAVTVLVAYAVLSLDQDGVELQQPFSPHSLSHLPLDDICRTLEGDLFAILEQAPAAAGARAPAAVGRASAP
jgi:putative membrane protein